MGKLQTNLMGLHGVVEVCWHACWAGILVENTVTNPEVMRAWYLLPTLSLSSAILVKPCQETFLYLSALLSPAQSCSGEAVGQLTLIGVVKQAVKTSAGTWGD